MILIIDNYDGCANNIYQLAGHTDPDIRIVRNDRITLDEIETMAPDHIIISGGSAKPENTGICMDMIRRFRGKIPILGICLGYRVICAVSGAGSVQMEEISQGKREKVCLDGSSKLFAGLPQKIFAGFYHSENVPENAIPEELAVTARCNGVPCAVENSGDMLYGLEFHPESFLSEYGREIMDAFLAVRA